MLIKSLLIFGFISSAILVYGIGLKHAYELSLQPTLLFFRFLRTTAVCVLSILISWLPVQYILVPVNLQELLPLVCLLVFLPVSALCEFLTAKLFSVRIAEICVSFPCIILALTVTTSLSYALFAALCFCISCYALVPVLYAIRKRLAYTRTARDLKTGGIILISLAVIISALYVWNISWLQMRGM